MEQPLLTATLTTSATFMNKAAIGPINITGAPLLQDPGSANDDLGLSPFRPGRYIWGGEPRSGILMHIDDASSIDAHINKAVVQDFLMGRSTPLPIAVDESIVFISTTQSKEIHSFWGLQLNRVGNYVDLTSGIQRIWATLHIRKLNPQLAK